MKRNKKLLSATKLMFGFGGERKERKTSKIKILKFLGGKR